MSVLDKLELTAGSERRAAYDPVQVRRRKLAAGLLDQIKLIDANRLRRAPTKSSPRRRAARSRRGGRSTTTGRFTSPSGTVRCVSS
jgi:hypothetical protein